MGYNNNTTARTLLISNYCYLTNALNIHHLLIKIYRTFSFHTNFSAVSWNILPNAWTQKYSFTHKTSGDIGRKMRPHTWLHCPGGKYGSPMHGGTSVGPYHPCPCKNSCYILLQLKLYSQIFLPTSKTAMDKYLTSLVNVFNCNGIAWEPSQKPITFNWPKATLQQ